MEDNDITALFCNLLDNAVEAAEKISEGCIQLHITRQASTPFTFISVINSCRVSPFSKDGRLPSSKKDSLRHGYGLRSITRIVEKYCGDIQMYYDAENTSFHTIIMLRNQEHLTLS